MGFVLIKTSANSHMDLMSCAWIIVKIVFIKPNNAWFFRKKVAAILGKDATSNTKQGKIYQILTEEE